MGPIALFDKSFLQSLSVDESQWFDAYFYANICPLFYVETLADLSKTSLQEGRTAEREVAIIAEKTPELSGAPCVHHRELCIGSLTGYPIPMNGQIPVANGQPVRSGEKRGIVFERPPEAEALARWQRGEFREVERRFAHGWRDALSRLDLESVAKRMRAIGIDPKSCKSLEDARSIAGALVNSKRSHFDQMGLVFDFAGIPQRLAAGILQRWAIDSYRPLAEYAPYAAHILAVELFFQIALGARLIATERPSNRVDVAYLNYLPFCMVFISSDNLHRRCAPQFLRADQEFIWGPDLKRELARVNEHFMTLDEEERAKGVLHLARDPVGQDSDLLIKIWDRHAPRWRDRRARSIELPNEDGQKLSDHLAPLGKVTPETIDPNGYDPNIDFDQISIERSVRHRRGSWWQLPRDMKTEKD